MPLGWRWICEYRRLSCFAHDLHQKGGGRIDANSKAVGLEVVDGAISAVKLARGGQVFTRHVVNAAGLLAGTVASWVGRKQAVTIRANKKNLVRVTGVGSRFRGPIIECHDDAWYFRPDGDGMLVGVGEGEDVELEIAARGEPGLDRTSVDATKRYLTEWTSLSAEVIRRIAPSDGWAGYRPLHDVPPLNPGEVSTQLPVFGMVDEVVGYYESCGWGEFGVTLGPFGGRVVAGQIVDRLDKGSGL